MRTTEIAAFFVTCLAASTAGTAQPAPRGGQFQVNSYTPDAQLHPAVAVDAAGQYLVVWETPTPESPGFPMLLAQVYSAAGAPQGAEFAIDTLTSGAQRHPAVASKSNGGFIVVWNGSSSSGTDTIGIQGRHVSAAGVPQGLPFQINSYTTGPQDRPKVASHGDGDFTVVWHSLGSPGTDNSGYSVLGQRYDSVGLARGGEFQVNAFTPSDQRSPDLAADGDGALWVVFKNYAASGDDPDDNIQARFYDASGTPINGPEFLLNQTTTGNQQAPAIAASPSGLFLATWESPSSSGSDSDGASIQGYLLNALGEALGDEFQVNSYTTANQLRPRVAPYGADGFVLAWQSFGSSGSDSDSSTQARTLAEPADFQVNSFISGTQSYPAIAAAPAGSFLVVWESTGSVGDDNESYSIQGQRFDALFSDGFESNSTVRWSGSIS